MAVTLPIHETEKSQQATFHADGCSTNHKNHLLCGYSEPRPPATSSKTSTQPHLIPVKAKDPLCVMEKCSTGEGLLRLQIDVELSGSYLSSSGAQEMDGNTLSPFQLKMRCGYCIIWGS